MEDFTVTSKGQVTIPRHIRQKLGIHAGSRVRFRIVDNAARLEVVAPAAPTADSGFSLLRSRRKSVPADFDPATLLDSP
ncbi:MAG: AbrB/MazE/SpoVT family DNA-binding domain-containing protein [Lysobacteraceae bacterium]